MEVYQQITGLFLNMCISLIKIGSFTVLNCYQINRPNTAKNRLKSLSIPFYFWLQLIDSFENVFGLLDDLKTIKKIITQKLFILLLILLPV